MTAGEIRRDLAGWVDRLGHGGDLGDADRAELTRLLQLCSRVVDEDVRLWDEIVSWGRWAGRMGISGAGMGYESQISAALYALHERIERDEARPNDHRTRLSATFLH